jgi:hypothetical protein
MQTQSSNTAADDGAYDNPYPAYMTTSSDGQKTRVGENLRKIIYEHQRAFAVKQHNVNQRQDRALEPHTTSRDNACFELDEHTDLRQSAHVMTLWRKDPKHANMFNFLYRARRGALLEKAKAFSRIDDE